jgi:hypothetical protein
MDARSSSVVDSGAAPTKGKRPLSGSRDAKGARVNALNLPRFAPFTLKRARLSPC